MFVRHLLRAEGAGTKCAGQDWNRMTASEVLAKRRAALNAYAKKAKDNPSGARKRLMATGIYTKTGKLRPQYGGEPAAKAKG